jgi:large subunit ribosomal protein L12
MEYIYAALLLHKLDQEVSEENVKKVVAATGASVDESKIKTLIASLSGVDIANELANASLAAAPASGSSASAAPAEKKEEKPKKEENPDAAAEGLGALFG